MKKKLREQQRALAFYELVKPWFFGHFNSPYHLVELCAGNGNVGALFQQEGIVSGVTFVDLRRVRGLERTVQHIEDYEVIIGDINNYELPVEDVAVIAVHACGSLTDAVLEKAVSVLAPVAVMPCCYDDKIKKYDLQNPPDPRLLNYSRRRDYLDTVRLHFLLEGEYKASLEQIDPKITPMNNVLIGVPT